MSSQATLARETLVKSALGLTQQEKPQFLTRRSRTSLAVARCIDVAEWVRWKGALCCLTFELTRPEWQDALAARPMIDHHGLAAKAACRGGSRVERGVRPHCGRVQTQVAASLAHENDKRSGAGPYVPVQATCHVSASLIHRASRCTRTTSGEPRSVRWSRKRPSSSEIAVDVDPSQDWPS